MTNAGSDLFHRIDALFARHGMPESPADDGYPVLTEVADTPPTEPPPDIDAIVEQLTHTLAPRIRDWLATELAAELERRVRVGVGEVVDACEARVIALIREAVREACEPGDSSPREPPRQ